MYVNLDIPEVNVDYKIFARFWLKCMFGGDISDNDQVRALATTFVRLVESAMRGYQAGVAGTREYWSTHDKIALGAIQQATSHFETCICDMHRAVMCFTRLRRHQQLGALSVINNRRPTFVSASVHDQLRNTRNEIHHMEKLVMNGTIVQGKSTAIHADGLEITHRTEADQTIKTIDRLAVGNYEILFRDIANWLLEMSSFCELMTRSP